MPLTGHQCKQCSDCQPHACHECCASCLEVFLDVVAHVFWTRSIAGGVWGTGGLGFVSEVKEELARGCLGGGAARSCGYGRSKKGVEGRTSYSRMCATEQPPSSDLQDDSTPTCSAPQTPISPLHAPTGDHKLPFAPARAALPLTLPKKEQTKTAAPVQAAPSSESPGGASFASTPTVLELLTSFGVRRNPRLRSDLMQPQTLNPFFPILPNHDSDGSSEPDGVVSIKFRNSAFTSCVYLATQQQFMNITSLGGNVNTC